MNEIIKSLYDRKSVRVYEDRPIPEKMKQIILEAAAQAPSAGCQQLYTILDITDQKLKAELVKTCDNQPFIATAPMVLVFCADCKKWYDAYLEAGCSPRKPGVGDLMLAVTDTAIAAQNAVVAAQSFGIGSCYIGDIMENYEFHRELFDLPDWAFPIGMLCLGYYRENHLKKFRPRFEQQYIVFDEKYRHLSADEYEQMFAEQAKSFSMQNPYHADNYAQAFYARKTGAAFSKEMARSARVAMKQWDGRLLNPSLPEKK